MQAPQREFAVRREVLERFFDPPIGRSTFFDLVKRGKIVRVKGLRGFFRLNESLRRMGLPEVEKLPREHDKDEPLSDRVLSEYALALAIPDQPEPSELLDGILSGEEVLKVLRFQRGYADALRGISSVSEQLAFAQGVRDAAYVAYSRSLQ